MVVLAIYIPVTVYIQQVNVESNSGYMKILMKFSICIRSIVTDINN